MRERKEEGEDYTTTDQTRVALMALKRRRYELKLA
jgi:hypothetical protein